MPELMGWMGFSHPTRGKAQEERVEVEPEVAVVARLEPELSPAGRQESVEFILHRGFLCEGDQSRR